MSTTDLPRIVQAGDPVLRAAAGLVPVGEVETPAFRDLVATMISVMRAAPGVGLAAPQIGVSKQVIVFEDRNPHLVGMDSAALAERERTPLPLTVVVNPTLRIIDGSEVTFLEGCLSVTGYMALVRRATEVVLSGLDATLPGATSREWHLRGWPARIAQHEVDHLRGTLYVDRMYARSLCGPDETHRWSGRATCEIAAALGIDVDQR
jgi:peptide deformylase